MNNKGAWSFGSRRGLLAYVYNGVSLSTHVLNALVAENGSYIVQPCGHDLHGPTLLARIQYRILDIKNNTCIYKRVC